MRRLSASWHRLALPNAPSARSSHRLSVLNGKAYLFGGEETARHAIGGDCVVHVLDQGDGPPSSWKWEQLANKPSNAPPPRVAHGQAAIDGKLYIFGGRSDVEMGEGELNDLWSFDPEANEWCMLEQTDDGEQPSPLLTQHQRPAPRSFHAATAAGDKLYIFGGCGKQGRFADLHEYCTTNKRWQTLHHPDLLGRGGATMEASADGEALWIVGGFAGHETNDVLRFCLRTAWWDRKPSDWLRPRSVCAGFSMAQALMLFGGEVSPSDIGHEGAGGFANDLVAIDPKDGSPFAVAVAEGDVPPARGWAASATLSETEGLLVGGLAGSDTSPERLDDVWLLRVDDVEGA